MKTLENKWIIYDGNCKLCVGSKNLLTRFGMVPENRCLDYYDLKGPHLNKIDPEHFKYEMALIDEHSSDTLYGLEGIRYIFASRFPWLQKVRLGRLGFDVVNFFYQTISFNRYFLFPIQRGSMQCDCEPPVKGKYVMSWVLIMGMITALMTHLVGNVLEMHLPVDNVGIQPLSFVVLGLLVWQLTWAVLLLKMDELLDYVRHLFLILTIGLLILLPSTLLFWLPSSIFWVMLIANSAIGIMMMLSMHFRRMKMMRFSEVWSLSFLAGLGVPVFLDML